MVCMRREGRGNGVYEEGGKREWCVNNYITHLRICTIPASNKVI